MGDCLTTQSRPLSLSQHFRHTCGTRFKQRLVERLARGGTSPIIEAESLYDPKRLNNVLVYALADKYDIPELKELAKRKFHALMENEWTSMEFQAVTDAVFETTLSQDTSLRYIMSQICMDHFQNIIKDVRVRSVILGNKDVTHALLEYATREKINDMQLLNRALAKQNSMQDDLSRARLANRQALDQKKQRETMLQDELAEAKSTI